MTYQSSLWKTRISQSKVVPEGYRYRSQCNLSLLGPYNPLQYVICVTN